MENKLEFPRPGQRIVRSVLASLLCMVVYYLRGKSGIPFFAVVAALQCIQPSMKNMREMGRKRIVGTLIGAAWGALVLYVEFWFLGGQEASVLAGQGAAAHGDPESLEMLHLILVAACTGAVLYSTVVMKLPESAYFSAVVFLSIVMNHVTDENPSIYIIDRILDTTVGVVIGILMNSVHFPRLRHPEILFVSGIDQMMSEQVHQLSGYTKITLNRLIEDGAKFTVISKQSPAMIRETVTGVTLKHPVIAMDGAVMYDMNSRRYLYKEVMDDETGAEVNAFFRQEKVHYFINTIEDDLLVIYYHEMAPGAMERLYRQRRVSPYRNYVKTDRDIHTNVVYYLTIGPEAEVEAFLDRLMRQPFADRIRPVLDTYKCAEGDLILRVYSADATRERMLKRLKEHLQAEKIVKFGFEEKGVDVCLPCHGDEMVREMKRMFEPVSLEGWRNMLKV